MILSRRVALGGFQLDEIHERIVIQSVNPGTTEENVQTVSRMGGVGPRVTGAHWEKLEAMVEYAENRHYCRSQLLLGYFGENDAPTCGTCDICRANTKH